MGSNPFKAEEEKTIMWFSADVEYIGDSTENETFSYAFTVVYDGDYEFTSDPYNCSYTEDPAGGEWEQGSDSTTMTFEPLSSKTTRLARFCIEVPQQLETDTEAPLQVIFTAQRHGIRLSDPLKGRSNKKGRECSRPFLPAGSCKSAQ